MNSKMITILKEIGINIIDIFICPHHWDDNCECRKPKTGNFIKAAVKHNLNLENMIYIGDDIRDEEAAVNSGCKSIRLSLNEECRSILVTNRGVYRTLGDACLDIVELQAQTKGDVI